MIECRKIYKGFRGQSVLEDVNLQFQDGKIYGILGKNGSGKSQLLKIIAGLSRPSEGDVLIDGVVLKKGEYAQNIGLVSDCIGFLPQYTATENLYSLAMIQKKIGMNEIEQILRIVGLDPNSKKVYKKFSLGMKQKLAIAQAFMEKPKILLLDEPMNGLDEDSIGEMRQFFKEYVKKNQALMILTSHNREDIEVMCDRIYKISNRKIRVEEE